MRVESLNIALAVIISASFAGFAIGTAPTERREAPLRSAPAIEASGDVPAARSYAELRELGPLRKQDLWTSDGAALREGLPDRGDGAEPAGDKLAILAARAARRAYDGAPPTIPHAVRQDAAAECLACHDEGALLRGRTASAMPHRELTNCTQCHTVERAPMPAERWLEGGPWAAVSSFIGRESPAEGQRAWSVAPPVIPHTTWMRERCESCHGVSGANPIKSSHPERQSCQQCHAISASLDLRPGAFAEPVQP